MDISGNLNEANINTFQAQPNWTFGHQQPGIHPYRIQYLDFAGALDRAGIVGYYIGLARGSMQLGQKKGTVCRFFAFEALPLLWPDHERDIHIHRWSGSPAHTWSLSWSHHIPANHCLNTAWPVNPVSGFQRRERCTSGKISEDGSAPKPFHSKPIILYFI